MTFSGEPLPVHVDAKTLDGEKVTTVAIVDKLAPELTTNLLPGTYVLVISADQTAEGSPGYAPVQLRPFHISRDGATHYPDGRQETVNLVQKVAGMRPGRSVPTDLPQPALCWNPVAGAAYYEVKLFTEEDDLMQTKSPRPEYQVENALEQNQYGWSVSAHGANGKLLAASED